MLCALKNALPFRVRRNVEKLAQNWFVQKLATTAIKMSYDVIHDKFKGLGKGSIQNLNPSGIGHLVVLISIVHHQIIYYLLYNYIDLSLMLSRYVKASL